VFPRHIILRPPSRYGLVIPDSGSILVTVSSRTINVVFVWAVIVLCQGLAGSEPVIVGLYDNPPKLSQAPSGVAVGFFPDLLDGIADAKGWEIEYRHGSWEVLLNWLESGEIDLLPDIAFSEERAARFAFSQEPVLSSWSTLYVPRGKAGMIVSELDLEGMRIAILPGSIQFIDLGRDLTALEVAVDYVEFSDFTSALEAVVAGEVDAALTNRLVGDLFVKERGQLEATSLIICPVQVYFAALSGPNEAILGAIDEQLLALKAEPDSLYHRAFNEWIRPVIAEQPRFFTLAMSAIGIALLAVVAFLFVRQRLNSRSTDLKRALKHVEKLNTALQVSEERQELAMANSRVALWDWDIEKHEVIFNEHWAKMLGMQLSDIPQPAKAEFWNEYTHPEDLEKVDLQLAEHFAGKRDSIECELRMRHLDGHYLWTLNRGAVIEWNEKGEAKRMVGTQAEITALVEAREEANAPTGPSRIFLR
jgi:PAS domain S-box-containing protein